MAEEKKVKTEDDGETGPDTQLLGALSARRTGSGDHIIELGVSKGAIDPEKFKNRIRNLIKFIRELIAMFSE